MFGLTRGLWRMRLKTWTARRQPLRPTPTSSGCSPPQRDALRPAHESSSVGPGALRGLGLDLLESVWKHCVDLCRTCPTPDDIGGHRVDGPERVITSRHCAFLCVSGSENQSAWASISSHSLVTQHTVLPAGRVPGGAPISPELDGREPSRNAPRPASGTMPLATMRRYAGVLDGLAPVAPRRAVHEEAVEAVRVRGLRTARVHDAAAASRAEKLGELDLLEPV